MQELGYQNETGRSVEISFSSNVGSNIQGEMLQTNCWFAADLPEYSDRKLSFASKSCTSYAFETEWCNRAFLVIFLNVSALCPNLSIAITSTVHDANTAVTTLSCWQCYSPMLTLISSATVASWKWKKMQKWHCRCVLLYPSLVAVIGPEISLY